MRTTVDLPIALHERARALASERGTSLSSVVAELAMRGLGTLGAASQIARDDRTGLPVIRIGRPITDEDVAAALDDE